MMEQANQNYYTCYCYWLPTYRTYCTTSYVPVPTPHPFTKKATVPVDTHAHTHTHTSRMLTDWRKWLDEWWISLLSLHFEATSPDLRYSCPWPFSEKYGSSLSRSMPVCSMICVVILDALAPSPSRSLPVPLFPFPLRGDYMEFCWIQE